MISNVTLTCHPLHNKRTLYCINPWKLRCLTEETPKIQQQATTYDALFICLQLLLKNRGVPPLNMPLVKWWTVVGWINRITPTIISKHQRTGWTSVNSNASKLQRLHGNIIIAYRVTHLSMQTNVTSPLYTVVHRGYIVMCMTFSYTLCTLLHETAHILIMQWMTYVSQLISRGNNLGG